MARNKGKGTEEWVEMLLKAYRNGGIADIEKVDPPTRVVWAGRKPKVIMMENPFLDYFGTWTERGGRAVTFEVKHTEDPLLKISRSGGITENQWKAMLRWQRAGAATFVLWEHRGEFRVATAALIEQALLETRRASLPWSHAIRLLGGKTDFLNTVQHLT